MSGKVVQKAWTEEVYEISNQYDIVSSEFWHFTKSSYVPSAEQTGSGPVSSTSNHKALIDNAHLFIGYYGLLLLLLILMKSLKPVMIVTVTLSYSYK